MLIASSFDGLIPWILAALAGIFLLGATSVVLSARGHWAGVLLAVPLLMLGIVGIRSLMTDTHRNTLSLESWAINLSPLALCATSVTLWLRHQVGPRKGRAPSSPRSYDPDTPLFELFVADKKVGVLCEPKREEMFWCSYRIEPSSEEADKILREEKIWNEVKFTVRAKDGRIPNAHTFTGGNYVAFCRRQTNRLSFRSLWPIDS